VSERDERLAGRVPMWAWQALAERPPYPPGYEPRILEVDEEEDRRDRERAAIRWAEANPDEPPPHPNSFTLTRYDPDTPDKDSLEFFHHIPIERVLGRVDGWKADAEAAELPARAEFWNEKADALDLLDKAGYLDVDDLDLFPSASELARSFRDRASSARRLIELAEQEDNVQRQLEGTPPLRLAEPSRENDKWGPLIPFLDHAMQTTQDDSSDGILRQLAKVCRENGDAAEYCRQRGLDISFQMELHPTKLSKLKQKVFELRRTHGA